MRNNKTGRAVLVAALTAAMSLGVATMALAGASPGDPSDALIVTPTDDPGEREVATFDFETIFTTCVDQVQYRIWSDDDGEPGSVVVPEVQVELAGDNPERGSFDVPAGLEGGWYWFEIECETDGLNGIRNGDGIELLDNGLISITGDFGFARLLVTVDVEGDVPDDTTFDVTVECDTFGTDDFLRPLLNGPDEAESSFDVIRGFGPDGGESPVMLYEGSSGLMVLSSDFNPAAGDLPATCEVSQADVEGAETSSDPAANSPILIDIDDPSDVTVTFTNVFPTAEDDEEEEDEVDDAVDEAEPADPVEAEPDFTG